MCAAVVMIVAWWWLQRHVGVPDPWIDENATLLASQRTWSQLGVLTQGRDAPLLAYYVLVKVWLAIVMVHGGLSSTLTSIRLLSVLFGAIAALCLHLLLARYAGRAVGLVGAMFLLTLPGFVRYAQDARPYALMMAVITLSWLTWACWINPDDTHARAKQQALHGQEFGSFRWLGCYTVAVAAGWLTHLFVLVQAPTQLLATLLVPSRGLWTTRRRLGLHVAALLLAAVVTAFPLVMAMRQATGPLRAEAVTARSIAVNAVSTLLSETAATQAGRMVPTLLLLGAALTGLRRGRRRAITLVLVLWLVVPTLAAMAAALWRHNLLRPRYWVGVLPAVAGLSALGAVQLAAGIAAVIEGRPGVRLLGHGATSPRAARLIALGVVSAILVLHGLLQVTPQQKVRAPAGHGEHIAPVVALIQREQKVQPSVVIALTPSWASAILYSQLPEVIAQNPMSRVDPHSPRIWPVRADSQTVLQRVNQRREVLWVHYTYVSSHSTVASQSAPPSALTVAGFRPVWSETAGEHWRATLLRR